MVKIQIKAKKIGTVVVGDQLPAEKDVAAELHERWRRGEAFRAQTRIQASYRERPYLEALISLGVGTDHVRELWQMRLLRLSGGQLQVDSPSWLLLLGVLYGIGYAAVFMPFIAAPLLGASFLTLTLALFGTACALFMGAQWVGPWSRARRIKRVAAEVSAELQVLLRQM